MSFKYAVLKKAFSIVPVQKIMARPYDELQKLFQTGRAKPEIPKLSDRELDFSVFEINGFPVLSVKHKRPSGGVCVYVVGGGMLKYPQKSQAREMIKYAKELRRDMILPYYPLCPDHNLYDVYDFLYELYRALLRETPAEKIAFLGGSSGGNHTLGLISHINAKGEHLPMPGKVYASSPGTVLYTEEELKKAEELDKTDLVMSRKALELIFDGMAAGKEVPDYMKYLQKGDYTGLKEAYLCFGGDELFSAAAESIRKRMEECGVTVTLEVGTGLYHCYSSMPFVAEAKQGHENMMNYLRA